MLNQEHKIYQLLSVSESAISDLEKELSNLQDKLSMNTNDSKEEDILFSISEYLNVVIGSITANCERMKQVLYDLNTHEYSPENFDETIGELIEEIEYFNSQHLEVKLK